MQSPSLIEDITFEKGHPLLLILVSDEEFAANGYWNIIVDFNKILLDNMNIENAFEIFAKTFYVFSLKYKQNVARLFNFIECYYLRLRIKGVNSTGVVNKFKNQLK